MDVSYKSMVLLCREAGVVDPELFAATHRDEILRRFRELPTPRRTRRSVLEQENRVLDLLRALEEEKSPREEDVVSLEISVLPDDVEGPNVDHAVGDGGDVEVEIVGVTDGGFEDADEIEEDHES